MLGSLLWIAGLAATNGTPLSVASRCGSPLPNWGAAEAPLRPGQQVNNTMRLEEGRLLWNGIEVTKPIARQYLRLVNDFLNPQPLTVLTYSAQTPCESVQRTRLLIQKEIQCKPGECLEVVSSRR